MQRIMGIDQRDGVFFVEGRDKIRRVKSVSNIHNKGPRQNIKK